jgi:hypothetical protein
MKATAPTFLPMKLLHSSNKHHEKPFFCYLSFNAPHTPLQVPEEYNNMYKDIDPSSGFENDNRSFPAMSEKDKEDARKVYAMVTNIDDNVGKLLQKLEELEIADNTLVIFMTDNGPQQRRYNAGMRGLKSSVFRGGVRVPFYWRLPALYEGNRNIETVTAHIDVLPTLAELCNAEMPTDRTIDGNSFLPLLKGEKPEVFETRSLFFYWTRRYPELYNNIALQKGPFKLVGNTNHDAPLENFELYNIREDEFELKNILQGNRTLASEMKTELDQMIHELSNSPNLQNPPRIVIGSKHENPVYLNRNDAGGARGIWTQEEVFGFWRVKIQEGRYNIRIKFIQPLESDGTMFLETNSIIYRHENQSNTTDIIEMEDVYFNETECELIPHYMAGGKSIFPLWVELEKMLPAVRKPKNQALQFPFQNLSNPFRLLKTGKSTCLQVITASIRLVQTNGTSLFCKPILNTGSRMKTIRPHLDLSIWRPTNLFH